MVCIVCKPYARAARLGRLQSTASTDTSTPPPTTLVCASSLRRCALRDSTALSASVMVGLRGAQLLLQRRGVAHAEGARLHGLLNLLDWFLVIGDEVSHHRVYAEQAILYVPAALGRGRAWTDQERR
jgi:hypothetical protein